MSFQTIDKEVAAEVRVVTQMPEPELPPGWAEAQESLARATGLAILLVAGHQPPALVVSNNNSICRAFQSSPTHAHLCEPFCGVAYKRAWEAGGETHYRCHAGLRCFAMPLDVGTAGAGEQPPPLAVIGGRAFLSAADYRALVERIRAGDLAELFSEDLFRNIIFAAEDDLRELAARLEETAGSLSRGKRLTPTTPKSDRKNVLDAATTSTATANAATVNAASANAATVNASTDVEEKASSQAPSKASRTAAHAPAQTSAHPSSPTSAQTSGQTSSQTSSQHSSQASAQRPSPPSPQASARTSARATSQPTASESAREETNGASGATPKELRAATHSSLPVASAALSRDYFAPGMTLREACRAFVTSLVETYGLRTVGLVLRDGESFVPYCVTGQFIKKPPRLALSPKEIRLLQAASSAESITVPLDAQGASSRQPSIELFPLVIGQEVKGALLVGDESLSDAVRRSVAAYCRDIALPLEVLRLREELERRVLATTHLQSFTEQINAVAPEDAYAAILRHSAELLHSERGSLLLFDETANELEVKAAIGPRAEFARDARMRLGDSVSGAVLREGRPLVVRDIADAGRHPAPPERSYKSSSFISYPIIVGGRRIGVLNVTDKTGGGVYDEIDLGLLEMIAPQMALALDRAEWHQKATQFQLLSITDPLTGLLNRRYLEERLSEELERSKRHRFAISFLMVDIDDFKSYNDRNGHQAGDLALEMTAQCLKSALRSADVAARYGGEEFSILLPQTNQSEALVIAERIRRRVERTHYPHGKTQPLGAVTVSIGISSFGPNLDTPASVIHAADQALYIAKSRGKNCVDAFNPTPPHSSTDADQKPK